jgi:hypothetical protein
MRFTEKHEEMFRDAIIRNFEVNHKNGETVREFLKNNSPNIRDKYVSMRIKVLNLIEWNGEDDDGEKPENMDTVEYYIKRLERFYSGNMENL